MDFKQLTYFIAVVREGNISKAAKSLNISQPPLSTQLRDLETELGVTLFERGSRKITLTPAGKLFYGRACSILELSDLSKKELDEYKTGQSGTLRIGIISSVSSTLITPWLTGFHAIHPNIRFELFEGNTYEQIDKLRNNLIEVAIVRSPFLAEGLRHHVIKHESMLAVGHSHYFNGITTPVSLESLADKPFILYRRWETIIRNILHASSLEPNLFLLNDDARTTVSMADAGLGIGIIPESAASLLQHPDTITHRLINPELESDICLLLNGDRTLSTIGELFFSFGV